MLLHLKTSIQSSIQCHLSWKLILLTFLQDLVNLVVGMYRLLHDLNGGGWWADGLTGPQGNICGNKTYSIHTYMASSQRRHLSMVVSYRLTSQSFLVTLAARCRLKYCSYMWSFVNHSNGGLSRAECTRKVRELILFLINHIRHNFKNGRRNSGGTLRQKEKKEKEKKKEKKEKKEKKKKKGKEGKKEKKKRRKRRKRRERRKIMENNGT